MYQKFIINQDGVLKFGHVYLHRELLGPDETCPYGGGVWKVDEARHAILLFGRSFDFGQPDFYKLRSIDWSGIGGKPVSLIYQPRWPSDEIEVPIMVNTYLT